MAVTGPDRSPGASSSGSRRRGGGRVPRLKSSFWVALARAARWPGSDDREIPIRLLLAALGVRSGQALGPLVKTRSFGMTRREVQTRGGLNWGNFSE
jgi:hypothetical protein